MGMDRINTGRFQSVAISEVKLPFEEIEVAHAVGRLYKSMKDYERECIKDREEFRREVREKFEELNIELSKIYNPTLTSDDFNQKQDDIEQRQSHIAQLQADSEKRQAYIAQLEASNAASATRREAYQRIRREEDDYSIVKVFFSSIPMPSFALLVALLKRVSVIFLGHNHDNAVN